MAPLFYIKKRKIRLLRKKIIALKKAGLTTIVKPAFDVSTDGVY
jgi:hypothetical protein